ncbi:transposase [Streptomyces caniscabiei]|uniref:transposase n=1 Tax=Streptomyces caniscabiei TaxID=2746961 RepID=UPI003AF32B61
MNSWSGGAGPVGAAAADRTGWAAAAADQAGPESALEGEITDHLGYEKHDAGGRGQWHLPQRGGRAKTVLTDAGPVEVKVPRDTSGTFEPQTADRRPQTADRRPGRPRSRPGRVRGDKAYSDGSPVGATASPCLSARRQSGPEQLLGDRRRFRIEESSQNPERFHSGTANLRIRVPKQRPSDSISCR